jgi:hypothetical protein
MSLLRRAETMGRLFGPLRVPERRHSTRRLHERAVPQGISLGHTAADYMEMSMREDLVPVRAKTSRGTATSASFTKRQRDWAYTATVERYVAWAKELLDDTPRVIDNVVIRERRTEAARAVLDLLWTVMVERNSLEGEPHPVPGLSWHHSAEQLSRGRLELPAS